MNDDDVCYCKLGKFKYHPYKPGKQKNRVNQHKGDSIRQAYKMGFYDKRPFSEVWPIS